MQHVKVFLRSGEDTQRVRNALTSFADVLSISRNIEQVVRLVNLSMDSNTMIITAGNSIFLVVSGIGVDKEIVILEGLVLRLESLKEMSAHVVAKLGLAVLDPQASLPKTVVDTVKEIGAFLSR